MKKQKTFIPVQTDEDIKSIGVRIVRFSGSEMADNLSVPHRDKNYIFVIQRSGFFELMLDFRKVTIKDAAVFFIIPGQIHHLVKAKTDTWVISVDPFLIKDSFKSTFDQHFLKHDPVAIPVKKLKKLGYCILFLEEELSKIEAETGDYHVKHGFIDALIGLIAEDYRSKTGLAGPKELRNVTITKQFKALLFKEYKSRKKPSDYAGILKISTAYLNEAVKKTSGFTASYWIQKMIIMEAKRLLYYTELSVKEISNDLGFDQPAYFTRVFTAAEDISPQGYRSKYR
jgi:AraC-like DNA-binding protein